MVSGSRVSESKYMRLAGPLVAGWRVILRGPLAGRATRPRSKDLYSYQSPVGWTGKSMCCWPRWRAKGRPGRFGAGGVADFEAVAAGLGDGEVPGDGVFGIDPAADVEAAVAVEAAHGGAGGLGGEGVEVEGAVAALGDGVDFDLRRAVEVDGDDGGGGVEGEGGGEMDGGDAVVGGEGEFGIGI